MHTIYSTHGELGKVNPSDRSSPLSYLSGLTERAVNVSKKHSDDLQRSKALAQVIAGRVQTQFDDDIYEEPGHRRGNLDEMSLWQIAAGIQRPTCFSVTEVTRTPKLYLGLLVDCSGSMSSSRRMTQARQVASALLLGIPETAKVRTSLAGHTEVANYAILYLCKRPGHQFEASNLAMLVPQSGNLDGFALIAYARELRKDMAREDSGLIALICDGSPCHGASTMRDAIAKCRSVYNMQVLVIGISDSMTPHMCDQLYGTGNYVLVDKIENAGYPITSKLNQVIRAMSPTN